MDSDTEEEEKQVIQKNTSKPKPTVVDQFPALSIKAKVTPTQPTSTISYAGMASKTKSEYEDEQFLKAKLKKNAVPMPKLERSQAAGSNVIPAPKNSFWDGWDESNEDEMEYAATQIEMEEHKKKLFSLTASTIDWTCESDDEDW